LIFILGFKNVGDDVAAIDGDEYCGVGVDEE
jgi:hypothetical protein